MNTPFRASLLGTDCQCEVLDYIPARPMQVTGPGMGDAFAPEPAEFTFRLLDDTGERLHWLEANLSDKEIAYLHDCYLGTQ